MLKQTKLGIPVADVIHKIGSSEQAFCRRKKHHASLEPDQEQALMQFHEEISGLKKLVADLSLDKEILSDISSVSGRPTLKREAFA